MMNPRPAEECTMAKKSIDSINVAGRRVLMRVDFNVPLERTRITDDRRIEQALPSIRSVLDRGGRLILMSHLGRPRGQGFEAEHSLAPVRLRLAELLNLPDLKLASGCAGAQVDSLVAGLRDGQALLLENLRFHAEETLIDQAKKNPDKKPTADQAARIAAFAAALSRHGDIYCNDAFGTCHRKHASMYDVPLRFPAGARVCGFLVKKELKFLGDALAAPARPFVAVLGGAKVSDKIAVIERLLPRVDALLIGGAMAFTFAAARGGSVGKSLCETDKLDLARDLMQRGGDKLRLPLDAVCAERIASDAAIQTLAGDIPDPLMGLDIGPRTIDAYRRIVSGAKTLVWNGPMGVFETPPFDAGTLAVAQAAAEATQRGAVTIIGGGDSAAAVDAAGLADRMSHISTGGGASLEFLEGKPFATIELLDEA